MCGKLKTIRTEVRNCNGVTSYTHETREWPPPDLQPDSKRKQVQDELDSFPSQHTLGRIMRGDLNLNSMTDENRRVWKLIFDEIEEESSD